MTRLMPAFVALLMILLAASPAQAEDQLSQASLSITNMVCVSCQMRVEQAVTAVEGVSSVSFDEDGETVVVAFDPQATSLDAILSACEEAGYPASVVKRSDA